MGRGGHHFSGGHYRHHHRSSDEGLPLSVTIPMLLIISFVLFLMDTAERDNIRNGEKLVLMEAYAITDYLYDNADYFDDSRESLIIEGLHHFHETTGVQMVIVTQNEKVTDKITEEKYYEMFDDEAHILLILPVTSFLGSNNVQYYYIGDEALKAIDETGINRLLENIENSWSSREERWKQGIIDIADLIAS